MRGYVADFANAAEVFVRHAVGELLDERCAHHLRVGKRVVLEDRAKHALGKLSHDLRAFAIVAVAKEAFGPLAEIGKRRIVKLKRRKVHERSRCLRCLGSMVLGMVQPFYGRFQKLSRLAFPPQPDEVKHALGRLHFVIFEHPLTFLQAHGLFLLGDVY